ncbi:MAG: SUMF1/EgtB/PvdO family nonheme iron enzyme [Verrucomicrobiota bacterium]
MVLGGGLAEGGEDLEDLEDFGDAGNAGDNPGGSNPNPVGAVAETYFISKFEVSRDIVTKANAGGGLGITLADMSSLGGNGPNRPATGISWYEAATFVNYLNTSQGFDPAYNFDSIGGTFSLLEVGDTLDYDPSNPYRSIRSNYWLPDVDEWYKAAYFDPVSDTYFDYPTGQNVGDPPTAVMSGVLDGTAVYNQATNTGPADIDNAGGLSPFGTMAQGGNAIEWEETAFDLTNSSPTQDRGLRGGAWNSNEDDLRSSERLGIGPAAEGVGLGFRVAGASVVPEPSGAVLAVLGLMGVLMSRRRGR